MLRRLLFVTSLVALSASAPVLAAPCKDTKGKFTKCPDKAAPKTARCKTANGKFAKCGTPGAKPA